MADALDLDPWTLGFVKFMKPDNGVQEKSWFHLYGEVILRSLRCTE